MIAAWWLVVFGLVGGAVLLVTLDLTVALAGVIFFELTDPLWGRAERSDARVARPRPRTRDRLERGGGRRREERLVGAGTRRGS